MVAQTELFLGHFAHDYYNPSVEGMNFNFFKQWLDMYPFTRSIIREMFMPRVWSLYEGYAVKQIIRPMLSNENNDNNNTTTDQAVRNSNSLNRASAFSGN